MAEGAADGSPSAWERTLADLRGLEAELREAGWEVHRMAADHVAPEPPGAGSTDRFGLVYVVPGNVADEFDEAMDAYDFTAFEVFRQRVGQRLYLIVKLTDPTANYAVLLAGAVDLSHASPLIEAAAANGAMYTHVQRLDGTHLGSFRHDDPSLFFEELA